VALQNTQSQQSIVRTDFTLKYYQIDELLATHRKLKIRGADSSVFMRSWLEFSLAREDIVIPWFSGDFESFLKSFSRTVKDSVADVDAFTQCVVRLQQEKPVVIAVNIDEVVAGEFTKLLDALKSSDSSMSTVASNLKDSGSATANKLEMTTARQALANIIIWSSKGELSATDYQGVLSQFTIALDVGGIEVAAHKSSNKGLYGAIGALVVVGCAGLYWQNTASIEPIQESLEVIAQPAQVEKSTQSNEGVVVQESVVSIEVQPSLSQETVVESALETPEVVASAAVETVIVASDNIQVADEQVEKGDKIDLPVVVAELSVEKEAKVQPVVSNGQLVVTAPAIKSGNIEIVEIVTTNSAPVINIGSSIKTVSIGEQQSVSEQERLEQQVSGMVDGWISAWQQQRFEGYSQYYVVTFSAKKNMSHEQWLDWRRKRIEKPQWIKLSRSNIKHLGGLDNGELSITFTLSYASPNYKDKTFKKLILKLEGEEFKIMREENLKVTRL